jgi:Rhs element Vgr protein
MGLDSLIPGTDGPTDVITCKIVIDGTELNNEILVSQVTINKSFNKIASAKLIFLDGSAAERDFPLSNDSQFKPGNEIEIKLGYRGDVTTVFKGIIIKHGIKIKESGTSLLMIEAKDIAIKLTGARKSTYFIAQTDSDIITSLVGDSTPDVASTSFSHKQLVQFDTTDWDFIVTRAEANSMLVLTDDGTLSVKKPATGAAVLTATYGDNIYEFEAEMDARKQAQAIQSHSWDYTQQEVEDVASGSANFTETGNISSDDLGDVLDTEIDLSHTGHLTETQLQDWADAYAMRNKLSKAMGRVRIQGNATVKPGTTITLDGVGDRFNGDVYVTGVLHHFSDTWRTDIQFGWQEDWFYKKEDVMNKPASGLLPGINGLQIGVVLDVNDTDEGGQYRIQVHVPIITSSSEGIWARVATLDAGDSRGVYFRPQVSDEVVLGFLNDDPREPVILGYLHSKDSKKSPLPEQDGMEQYGFVTKEGMKLIFDDTNKQMTILVKTEEGEKSIAINDNSGALVITDEFANTIKMDGTGITIDAGSQNVIIKGTTVMINS